MLVFTLNYFDFVTKLYNWYQSVFFFPLMPLLGFNEAFVRQCSQGHERAEIRKLFWPENRHWRQHEHLPVPCSYSDSIVSPTHPPFSLFFFLFVSLCVWMNMGCLYIFIFLCANNGILDCCWTKRHWNAHQCSRRSY